MGFAPYKDFTNKECCIMNKPKVLTKFTNYHDNIFSLDENIAGVKISLPFQFNDNFDNQLIFNKEFIQSLSLKYDMPEHEVELELDHLSNSAHILCLIGNSAINTDTANMWGLYASNGKGLAGI